MSNSFTKQLHNNKDFIYCSSFYLFDFLLFPFFQSIHVLLFGLIKMNSIHPQKQRQHSLSLQFQSVYLPKIPFAPTMYAPVKMPYVHDIDRFFISSANTTVSCLFSVPVYCLNSISGRYMEWKKIKKK